MPIPSNRPGMGSNPSYPTGVTFRIWAPNAEAVSVQLSPGAVGVEDIAPSRRTRRHVVR